MMAKLTFKYGLLACTSFLLFMTSCYVDDRCDLSKDIDATIEFGDGISVPVGSTEKIMLSDIIDTAETDVVEVDAQTGDYSISMSGTIDPQTFSVGVMDVAIAASTEQKHYDFELVNLSEVSNLPFWVVEEMKKQKYPFVVHHNVDYTVNFDASPNVPKEIKKIRKLSFDKNVKLAINIKMFSQRAESEALLELVNEISLKSQNNDGFLLQVPEYLVFADGSGVENGNIMLDGVAKFDAKNRSLTYTKELYIKALDFTHLSGGYLAVNDGVIDLHNELRAVGYIESDTVLLGYNNLTHIHSVDLECSIDIEKISIKEVEGVYDYDIDPVDEVLELSLGDDLEFLKDAYFDFNDPRIYLSLNNPVNANILASARFDALDENNNQIDGANVAIDVELMANTVNNLYINRYNNSVEGYRTVVVPNLNNLLKQIPDKVKLQLDARVDASRYTTLTLGKEYEVTGDYRISLPMNFDEFRVSYTGTFNDVLGNTDDYVNGIAALSLSFDVLNTIPLELVPEIIAYDSNDRPMNLVSIELDGAIKKGNGVVNGNVTEPVVSSVKIKLSASNDELKSLDRIDIKLTGSGFGVFNANEYLQLKNIVLSVDEPIAVDLNYNY